MIFLPNILWITLLRYWNILSLIAHVIFIFTEAFFYSNLCDADALAFQSGTSRLLMQSSYSFYFKTLKAGSYEFESVYPFVRLYHSFLKMTSFVFLDIVYNIYCVLYPWGLRTEITRFLGLINSMCSLSWFSKLLQYLVLIILVLLIQNRNLWARYILENYAWKDDLYGQTFNRGSPLVDRNYMWCVARFNTILTI